jgi:hypothetical protein
VKEKNSCIADWVVCGVLRSVLRIRELSRMNVSLNDGAGTTKQLIIC